MDFKCGFCQLFIVFARIEDDKNITGFIIENNPENGITLGEEEHKLVLEPLHVKSFLMIP